MSINTYKRFVCCGMALSDPLGTFPSLAWPSRPSHPSTPSMSNGTALHRIVVIGKLASEFLAFARLTRRGAYLTDFFPSFQQRLVYGALSSWTRHG